MAGARALFMTAAGSIESETVTDSTGHAVGVVPPGGSVLVIEGVTRTSFYGVEDGDDLFVGTRGPGSWSAGAATMIVPSGPPGTLWYQVQGPCLHGYSTTTTLSLSRRTDCPPGPRDLLVTATTSSSPAYLTFPGLDIAHGTTYTATGPWQPPVPLRLELGNVPPNASLAVAHLPMSGPWSLGYELHGIASPAAGGQTVGTVPHPPPIGDGTRMSLSTVGERGQTTYRHSTAMCRAT